MGWLTSEKFTCKYWREVCELIKKLEKAWEMKTMPMALCCMMALVFDFLDIVLNVNTLWELFSDKNLKAVLGALVVMVLDEITDAWVFEEKFRQSVRQPLLQFRRRWL